MQTVVETPSYLSEAQALLGPEQMRAVVEATPIFLLAIFGKNEKDNLSKAERNLLKKSVNELFVNYGG